MELSNKTIANLLHVKKELEEMPANEMKQQLSAMALSLEVYQDVCEEVRLDSHQKVEILRNFEEIASCLIRIDAIFYKLGISDPGEQEELAKLLAEMFREDSPICMC